MFCLQTDVVHTCQILSFVLFDCLFILFGFLFLNFYILVCFVLKAGRFHYLCVTAVAGLICGVCVALVRFPEKSKLVIFVFYGEIMMFHVH